MSRVVKLGEPQTVFRQAVEVRRLDFAAITAGIGEAHVVDNKFGVAAAAIRSWIKHARDRIVAIKRKNLDMAPPPTLMEGRLNDKPAGQRLRQHRTTPFNRVWGKVSKFRD